ncbi:MAG: asparaginase, partial [Alphaproteobacteria bacterium]|nr:asparaginase [Alphaproteobacteria bacterium]
VQSITSNTADKFIICHGTNTLIETAQYLAAHFLIKDTDKTIILTGAIIPLKQFILSDGGFNLGYAVGQSYNLSSGVHICMHGKIFLPQNVTKNRAEARFEEL